MKGLIVDEKDKEELKKFFTNPFGRVTAFTSLMKQVDAGAIFSRYSRSPDIAETIFVKEFLNNPDRGEDFYAKVLALYGDDSIAELGGAHVMFQGVSQLAAKELEDVRIGLSPLEKSTRYVNFGNKDEEEKFQYIRPSPIMGSSHAELFENTCNNLFETYVKLADQVFEWAKEKFPKQESETDRGFISSRKAKGFDITRALLPAATKTNVGIYGNGRAFEYLLLRMNSSPLQETTDLANDAYIELEKVIPAFVKRIKDSKYGEAHSEFLRKRDESIRQLAKEFLGEIKSKEVPEVELIQFSSDKDQIVSRILYEGCELPLSQIKGFVENKTSDSEKQKIINAYLEGRDNRRHKPGRAFEVQPLVFDINADFGIYRDLHRQRMQSQVRQKLNTRIGFTMPDEIRRVGAENEWKEAMKISDEVFRKIEVDHPFEAQYIVPLAYKIRWYMGMNPRELFWVAELRTTPQGHPNYRRVVNKMWDLAVEKNPLIFNSKVVEKNREDCEKSILERQESEKRIDKKMKELENT